jgi:sugar lactone lactonase YvrE
MRSVRGLLHVLLILLFPVPASAFRSRPLADLRMGNGYAESTRAASDGTGFLVGGLMSFDFKTYVVVQKIAGGSPAGSWRVLSRAGYLADIAWTGSSYLVAWSDENGDLRVAEVSREGTILQMPTEPVMRKARWFATNGRTALAMTYDADTGRYVVQPVDLRGRKSGASITFPGPQPLSDSSLQAAADGYLFFTASSGTGPCMLFRDDGRLRTTIPGPRYGFAATDGLDTVLFYKPDRTTGELWTMVLAADGTIKRPANRIAFFEGEDLWPATPVWNGSQYVVAVTTYSKSTYKIAKTLLYRVSRGGDAVGDPIDAALGRRILDAVSNEHDLLLMLEGGNAALFAQPMLNARPASLWQTANPHYRVALAAAGGGYLAAWSEITGGVAVVRASRVDAAGNYLDGEGITLGTSRYDPYLSVASDGREWLVTWATGPDVQAARVSAAGTVLDSPPLSLGLGSQASVQWNGSRYVIVIAGTFSPPNEVRSVTVTRDGKTTPPRLLDHAATVINGSDYIYTYFLSPSLAAIGDEMLLAWVRLESTCHSYGVIHCIWENKRRIDAQRLDGDGAAAGPPFTIAIEPGNAISAAADGSGYLVAWSQDNGLFAARVLSGPMPRVGTPFRIAPEGQLPSLAFDGRDYVAAWQSRLTETVATARISREGAVSEITSMPVESDETATRPAVSASAGLPPLVGFVSRHRAYDLAPRAAMLFASELAVAAAPPPAPLIAAASRAEGDSVTVQWHPAVNAFGIAIELELADGSYREIGVAAAGATSARIPLYGLSGSRVRVRAWNSAGDSEPSAALTLLPPKQRSVR